MKKSPNLNQRISVEHDILLKLCFLLRKIGPELTSMPTTLYFICGTPATAWFDKQCVGPCLGSESVNPGLPKRNV